MRATRIARSLDNMTFEKSLEEVTLFSIEKGRMRGHLLRDFIYTKVVMRSIGVISSLCPLGQDQK